MKYDTDKFGFTTTDESFEWCIYVKGKWLSERNSKGIRKSIFNDGDIVIGS